MTTTAPTATATGRQRRAARHDPEASAQPRGRDRRRNPHARAVGRRRVSSLPFLGLIAGLLAAGLLGLLIINNSLAAGSFEQARLRSDQILLGEQEQALRQEVERLSSPTRVREAARQAGLVPAATTAYFDVMTGQILGVPLPAGQVAGVPGTEAVTDTVIIDPATGQPIDPTTDPLAADPLAGTPDTGTVPADPAVVAPDAAQPPAADSAPRRGAADTADDADGAVVGTEPGGVTAYDRAIVSGGGR